MTGPDTYVYPLWQNHQIFKRLNPHLMEGQGSDRCRGLWDLLTPRHREGPACCHRGDRYLSLEPCFLGHSERWKDRETGLPVVVAHPGCRHRVEGYDGHHEPFRSFFADRGLAYLVTSRSWYRNDASLVVIARADVIDRIRIPLDGHQGGPVLPSHWPRPDWEMKEALRLAKEAVLRKRRAESAQDAEKRGYHQNALELYCGTAYIDRTGGFQKLARDQLTHAKRVLDNNPGLDLSSLHFKNNRDRADIYGPVLPLLSRAALEQRLGSVQLPPECGRFTFEKDEETEFATVRIDDGYDPGDVRICQGGTRNLWRAWIDMDERDRIETQPYAHDPEQIMTEERHHCWPDPESAVKAAVKMWQDRYGPD